MRVMCNRSLVFFHFLPTMHLFPSSLLTLPLFSNATNPTLPYPAPHNTSHPYPSTLIHKHSLIQPTNQFLPPISKIPAPLLLKCPYPPILGNRRFGIATPRRSRVSSSVVSAFLRPTATRRVSEANVMLCVGCMHCGLLDVSRQVGGQEGMDVG